MDKNHQIISVRNSATGCTALLKGFAKVCILWFANFCEVFFLAASANFFNFASEKTFLAMIFTDREWFLLAICSVFYVTLFILVVEYSRRKIQLLQSRLDHIHDMQKLAVMEQKGRDMNEIFTASVYLRIKKYLAEGKSMADADWTELADTVNKIYCGFNEKIYSLCRLSEQDFHVSLLIKIRLQPKDIATLTAHSKESIASTRSRLYQKVFGKKGSTRDWDDFILSI